MPKPALFVLSALIFALSLPTQAASTAGKPANSAAPPSAAKAKADLARLAELYKSAQTLQYTSTVTITDPTSPTPVNQTFQAKASIDRPNLVRVEIGTGGKMSGLVVANGAKAYAYDPAGNRYFEYQNPNTGPAALVAPLDSASPLLGPPANEVEFTAVMFVSPHPYDLSNAPAPGGFHFSETSAVLDGRPVSHIVERAASAGTSVTLNVYLDKQTGLPRRVVEDVVQNGLSYEPLREDFTSIQLGNSPLVASNFTWTPPAGAAVFTPPPSPDAQKPEMADGTDAPDFAAQTSDGKDIHLSDFKGKVIVLDFWATWCGPCQMALPYTDKIARAYTSKGVVFLPICSGDTKNAFLSWLGQHKTMFMQFYYDPPDSKGQGNVIGDLYKIEAIPTQYVIGKDGKIAGGFLGYDSQDDPSETALEKAIDKALAAS